MRVWWLSHGTRATSDLLCGAVLARRAGGTTGIAKAVTFAVTIGVAAAVAAAIAVAVATVVAIIAITAKKAIATTVTAVIAVGVAAFVAAACAAITNIPRAGRHRTSHHAAAEPVSLRAAPVAQPHRPPDRQNVTVWALTKDVWIPIVS